MLGLPLMEKEYFKLYDYAPDMCLMYELVMSSKDCEIFFIGFDESNERPKQELTYNIEASSIGRFHAKIFQRKFWSC